MARKSLIVNRQVNGGDKYQAPGMADRIVKEQSVEVDTVSGVTLISKTILVAVHIDGRIIVMA